jgi:putative oxidoreductase
MQSILFLLGRILFGGYFLMSAFNHFKNAGMLSGYAESKGVPAPKLSVLASGVLLLIGGLSVLFGLYPTIGALALVLFLVPVSFTMHAYWKVQDPQMKMVDRINFMKNLALLGAALLLLFVSQPWPESLRF